MLLVVLLVVVSCFAVGCDVLRRSALIGNRHGSALRGRQKEKHTNIPSRETHKSAEEEWEVGGGCRFSIRRKPPSCQSMDDLLRFIHLARVGLATFSV